MTGPSLRRRIAERYPGLRRLVSKIVLYVRIPYALVMDTKTWLRLPAARRRGLVFHPPNFLYKDDIGDSSAVVDVGCGYEADFSVHMINTYGADAIGIDPTEKHARPLRELEKKSNGKFKHKKWLISKESGKVTFYESIENESGSIDQEHINIRKGTSHAYEVESVNLNDLPSHLNLKEISILKLDIEGAEFDLFRELDSINLEPFRQLYIEFHHRSVKRYSKKDTLRVVRSIRDKGFKVFSLDDINFLCYH